MTTLGIRLRSALEDLLRPDDDALAAYRGRIALQLSMLAVVVLLPFTINHLVVGRWLLGGLIAATQAVLLLNGLALRAGREAPVPFWLMVLAMVIAVTGSIWIQGSQGSLWAYPTLFITYFLVRRRVALLLSLLLVVSATAAAALSVGDALALRVVATLTLTLVMINVVLNVVGELQEALVAQAITDPLTGAYNRRHLDTQLAALPAPLPGQDAVNMLMALDIDHFKQVNDIHGHAVGDDVLRGLVATLHQRLRPSDRLFRIGGEEFVLLLPRITAADAMRLAEDLRQRVAQAPLLPEGSITVSIGVAAQRPGLDTGAWMRVTDEALYEAKRSGRNRVVMAD
ncbi:MAG: GGDEF domain-containing protein [Rubrivivax sp.]|nr:GGDEF domain-containing protein [Rubrivivax sp.]